jgi:hypothetical protein
MKPIMRILVIFLVFLIQACTSIQTMQLQSPLEHNKSNARYSELVNSVKAKPSLEAITELRQLTILTDRFKTNIAAEKTLNQSLFEAMDAGNWSACLQKSHEALARHYASLNSHYAAMVCSIESGEALQGQYHESVINYLLEAVWTTGDGESIETAFQVINEIEQNAFLEFHGLEFIKHNVTRRDGQSYNLVTLYDARKDKAFEWYFDISAQTVFDTDKN